METLLKTYLNDSIAWTILDQNIDFIITCIEIPLILFAIFSLTRSTQTVRFVVINLLIADLIAICMSFLDTESIFYILAITWVAIAALHFRMCIAIERYSQIACPGPNCPLIGLVHTLLSGWLLPLIVLPGCFYFKGLVYVIPFIPHVVVIVCFVGACWSLFHSTSLTPMEKSFALAPNFLMLISYIILTLPIQIIIFILVKRVVYKNDLYLKNSLEFTLFVVFIILYILNPLVDCLLCVFMRSDAENTRTSHCFSRLKRNQRETDDASSADV